MDLVQQEWSAAEGRYVDQVDPVPEPILAAQRWRTNAELVWDVSRLGYIGPSVLDMTCGEGGFWKLYHPDILFTNDLDPSHGAFHHHDFRNLPVEWSGQFDTVVFDPPYKMNGTPVLVDMDWRYGVDQKQSPEVRMAAIYAGLFEAARVVRIGGTVLVKCMDQVVSGRVVWQTDLITRVCAGLELTKVDRFDLLRTPMPQPPGRKQVHARRNYSTLLVFRKDRP